MTIKQEQLHRAAEAGIIQPEQVAPLLTFLQQDRPRFDFSHLLYYFGGLLAMGALSLFMTLGWEEFGGWGILGLSALYILGGLLALGYFQRRQQPIVAGICAAFVVTVTPLAIYGLQQAMGWWPVEDAYRDYHRWVKPLWLYMELGTLIAGAVLLWRAPYAFVLMPLSVTLWYLSMDTAELVLGSELDWQQRGQYSIWFGLTMTALALWVDIRRSGGQDYAFWLYLFGVITFWGGLSSQHSDSELAKLAYAAVNLMMILIGTAIGRRVFVVFGALGLCGYLGHLAYNLFKDSWLFPMTLVVLGFAVIALGLRWQQHQSRLLALLSRWLPPALMALHQRG